MKAENTSRESQGLWGKSVPAQAESTEIDGRRVIESFGDDEAEYRAVREAVGLLDLTGHGAIRVGGKEGSQFLQGLVTNDVKDLKDLQGVRCGFLTGHGKVRALARVLRTGDEFLILTDPETHQKVFKYVFPFSYAGDFKVDDVSSSSRLLSLQGPNSLLVLKEVCFEPVPRLALNQAITSKIAGHDITVIRSTHTGEDGYDLLVPDQELHDVWDFLLLKGGFHSIRPVGTRALEVLRVEAGIPIYQKDVDETNMMLEVGLSDAVSFTKGCYTGQEAVAMATYRGHISKQLMGLRVEGEPPAAGDTVLAQDKEVGRITSSTNSPVLGKPIAIGYLKYGFLTPGLKVEILTAQKRQPAEVTTLPFINNIAVDA